MFKFFVLTQKHRDIKKFNLIEQIPTNEFIDILLEFEKKKEKDKEKLVLVLPGGGARGRWQFGVIYWLYQIGLLKYVDLICGTSVGGLNTLLTAKYANELNKALEIWNSITRNEDIYTGMMKFSNLTDIIGMISQILKDNQGKCIIRPDGLYKLIDTHLGNLTLKDLKINVAITTTTMFSGEMKEINTINNPDFLAAKLAKLTSAIPIIFPAVEFELNTIKDLGVDGGLGRNNPVELAIKHGATKIILIGTSPNNIERKEIKNNIISIASRLESVIMHIFEEFAWDSVELYKKFNEIDPEHYPTIEFLDIYPNNGEYENDCLNFTKVETLQYGYNSAVKNFTLEKIREFLLK